MKYDKVFRLRLTKDQQQQLREEARERGLSKADRIRQALGWPLADAPERPPRAPAPPPDPQPDPPQPSDAVQQLADRLKGP